MLQINARRKAWPGGQCISCGTPSVCGAEIQIMAKRQNRYAHYGVDHLHIAMGQAERAGHDAKAQRSDRYREQIAMAQYAASKTDAAQHNGNGQSKLMHPFRAEKATKRRGSRDKDCRCNAMHHAHTGQQHGRAVPQSVSLYHRRHTGLYSHGFVKIQHHMPPVVQKLFGFPAQRDADRRADGLRAKARQHISSSMTATRISAPTASATSARLQPIAIANWLLAVAALVFCMVVVGGITRLTESGLSITEWQPITGAIPPLSLSGWEAEFAKYKATPEYQEITGPAGMTLSQFQFIFFWEWAHRLLGRLIGIAFALPLAFFWIRRAIPKGYKPRLLALLALGGLQGAIGWWMVVSGLTLRTDVSHYRLAVHLLTALFILSGLVWTALDLRQLAKVQARPARLTGRSVLLLAIVAIQLLYGAWVAGMDAGYVASDWPLMNGQFFPAGVDWSRGAAFAFSNDPFLVHFIHRWWAWAALAAVILLARGAKRAGVRPASIALSAAVGVQILLGIATVMSGVALPMAAAHQAVGALLVASAIWAAHAAGRRTA